MKYIKGAVCALLFILAATAAGLAFLHICDAVYLMDVRHYGLAESTGLTEEQIMDNYNAVMEYLSPFSQGEFDLPDLPFSESGAYHFYETKNIFRNVYIIGGLSAITLIIWLILEGERAKGFLKISWALSLIIPLAAVGAAAIDFNKAFILFHKVFFNNDMWMFDPAADPIIEILPEAFFMHCAMVIAAFYLAAAVFQLVLSKRKSHG